MNNKKITIDSISSKIFSTLDDVELSSLIRYICSYLEGKKVKISNARIEALFTVFKIQIDAEEKKQIDKKKKLSIAGKKGVHSKKTKKEQDVFKNDILPHFVPKPKNTVNEEIPSFQDVYLYVCTIPEYKSKAESIKFALQSKYDIWVDAGWKDGYNKPVKNWKVKIRNILPYLKPNYNANTTIEQKQRVQTDNRLDYIGRVLGEDYSTVTMPRDSDTEDTDFTDVSTF